MNIEELRAYCLSLGDVKEKFPFSRFNNGNAKYWMGVDAARCPDVILRRLIKDSFAIVSKKNLRQPKTR